MVRVLLILCLVTVVARAEEVSLDSPRAQDRYEAARRLGEQGEKARGSVEALVAALSRPDEEENTLVALLGVGCSTSKKRRKRSRISAAAVRPVTLRTMTPSST